MKIPTPDVPTVAPKRSVPPLSEAEIGFLETQIPAMAQVATQTAFWSALTRGQSVVCQSGNELVEIAPDGKRTFLDVLEKGPSLPVGTRLSLR